MPIRSKRPSVRLSAAISLSPCSTCIETAVWLSAAVEKIWLFFVGMVVFFSISFVITPPSVSIPSDNGVTSRRTTSERPSSPLSTPPCMAAPMATTSSGLTPLWGSLPNISFTVSCTFGILVWPPTSITSSMSLAEYPASFSALRQGCLVRDTKSSTSCSSLALVRVIVRCLGPVASAVTNGRFISVC